MTGHPHNWMPSIKSKCAICGKETELPNKGGRGRKVTCGNKDCISKALSIARSGDKNHNYKAPVQKVCPVCQSVFEEKPGHSDARVCCSRKCAAIYRSNNFRGSNHPSWKPKILVNCPICGKEIERLESDIIRQPRSFCSIECHGKWNSKNLSKDNHWNWKGGITKDPYCEKFTPEFRERVREYWGNACFECGTPSFAHFTKSGRLYKLAVHHVHYDKQMCCNGSPRDVIPLCTSCNLKVNINRDYWENHFTTLIYMYSPDGKCYLTREEMIALNGKLRT